MRSLFGDSNPNKLEQLQQLYVEHLATGAPPVQFLFKSQLGFYRAGDDYHSEVGPKDIESLYQPHVDDINVLRWLADTRFNSPYLPRVKDLLQANCLYETARFQLEPMKIGGCDPQYLMLQYLNHWFSTHLCRMGDSRQDIREIEEHSTFILRVLETQMFKAPASYSALLSKVARALQKVYILSTILF
jgi:hypothetical protein